MNSSGAFGVFINHWMIDENQAKKRDFYQKMMFQISPAVLSRHLVSEFHEMFDIFISTGRQDRVLWHRLQNSAMMLIVIRAVGGVCRECGKSFLRYEIHHRDDFIRVCQNGTCRDVDFFIFDLFA